MCECQTVTDSLSASPTQCKRGQPTTPDRSARRGGRLSCASRQPVEHLKGQQQPAAEEWVVGVRLLNHWPCTDALRTDAIGTEEMIDLTGQMVGFLGRGRRFRRNARPPSLTQSSHSWP